MVNVFQIIADMFHTAAIIILLVKIVTSRSCAGLSAKSQVLYAIVFITRYLDLFEHSMSVYLTTMKIMYITLALITVGLMLVNFRETYDYKNDSFWASCLVVPAAILALFVNHHPSFFEICWTFSIYLEAVAIVPQLYMISQTQAAETITMGYLLTLGMYRVFYIMKWIHTYLLYGVHDPITGVSGCVQTVFYCHFFYKYWTLNGFKILQDISEDDV